MHALSTTVLFLAVLAAIVGCAALVGRLATALGQPRVVGEITAGVAAGLVLKGAGWWETDVMGRAVPAVEGISQIGVAVFLFLIGCELRGFSGRQTNRAIVTLAACAFAVPFVAGTLLGLGLPAGAGASPLVSALFLGIAVAVSALPVLTRITSELGITRLPLGRTVISASVLLDLICWALLGSLGAAQSAGGSMWSLLAMPAVLALIAATRPVLRRLLARRGESDPVTIAVLGLGLLASAGATEAVGLHLFVGALAFGLAVPPGTLRWAHPDGLAGRIAVVLLLPAFFVLAGTDAFAGATSAGAGLLGAVVVVAFVSKAGGAYLGARLGGAGRSTAGQVAALLNARGLTEIVVLGVGRQMHLVSDSVYTAMLAATIVTTVLAVPLVRLFDRLRRREPLDVPVPEPTPFATVSPGE